MHDELLPLSKTSDSDFYKKKEQLTGLQQTIEKIDPSWCTERRRLPP